MWQRLTAGLLVVGGLSLAAHADSGCLGGVASSSTCVSGTGAFGQLSSAPSTAVQSRGGVGPRGRGNRQRGVNQGFGQQVSGMGPGTGPGAAAQQRRGLTQPMPTESFGLNQGGLGASAISPLTSSNSEANSASNDSLSSGSSKNSLGEHVDYFDDDAERDANGGLVTCLSDAFGHHICM